MSWLHEFWFRLRGVIRKRRVDAEMADELRQHIELRIERNLAAGMSPEEARQAAQRSFGGLEQIKERSRDQRTLVWLEQWIQDVRFGGRSLRRHPLFTVVAAGSLAVGIGINASIFSVLQRVFFEDDAGADTGDLVHVFHGDARRPFGGHSYPAFAAFRARDDLFLGVAAQAGERPMIVGRSERPATAYVSVVSGEYFSVLGINAFAGRMFAAADDRIGSGAAVVVVSHDGWRRFFNSDPAIVGRTVVLNDRVFEVTAVAPPEFGRKGGASLDFWMPLSIWAEQAKETGRFEEPGHAWLSIVGRLRPTVSPEQAQTVLSAVVAQQLRVRDDAAGARITVRRFRDGDPRLRQAFWDDGLPLGAIAFVLGGLVLLVACANVANLLLARMASRRREIAVRLALGSSRARVLRQILAESLWIALLAAGASFFVAHWALDLMLALKPPMPVGRAALPALALNFELNTSVVLFAGVLSVVAAIAFGLPPAWKSARGELVFGLTGAPPRGSPLRWDLRNTLVVAQIAVCFVLVAAGGLLVRGWLRAHDVDPGFRVDNVLLLSLAPEGSGQRKSPEFARELLQRVRALPGIRAASVADPVPPTFGGNFAHFAPVESREGPSERVGYAKIAPGYFAAMGIALVRGRDFNDADTAASPAVAIVNETAARRWWPQEYPVGRQLRRSGRIIEIVGVARDSNYHHLGESPVPWLYVPAIQEVGDGKPQLTLVVKTEHATTTVLAGIKREVQALDPTWPIFDFQTLRQNMEIQFFVPRVMAGLLGTLGLFGLGLATIGVFGLVSYAVICRTREIGIRIAVGASAADIRTMVLKHGVTLALIGIALGAAIVVPLGRIMSANLCGISPNDWPALVATGVLLLSATIIAGFFPARRATKIDPIVALRCE